MIALAAFSWAFVLAVVPFVLLVVALARADARRVLPQSRSIHEQENR